MSGKHSVLSPLLAHIRHLIIPCVVDLAFEARVVSSGSLEQLWSGLNIAGECFMLFVMSCVPCVPPLQSFVLPFTFPCCLPQFFFFIVIKQV